MVKNDNKDFDSDLQIKILQDLDNAGPKGIRNIEKPFSQFPSFVKCMKDLKKLGFIEVNIKHDRGKDPEYSIRDAYIRVDGKRYLSNLKIQQGARQNG